MTLKLPQYKKIQTLSSYAPLIASVQVNTNSKELWPFNCFSGSKYKLLGVRIKIVSFSFLLTLFKPETDFFS